MTDLTFADMYCAQHGINRDDYEKVVLLRSLYPHARMVATLVRLLSPDHFAADVDFVRSVGRLRRYREFTYESEEFAHHPANRGFWRLTVNVRISSRALRRMVRATLHPDSTLMPHDDETAVPFDEAKSAAKKASAQAKSVAEAQH
jgi:hypothetical protein